MRVERRSAVSEIIFFVIRCVLLENNQFLERKRILFLSIVVIVSDMMSPEMVTIIGIFFIIFNGNIGGEINSHFERVQPIIIVPAARRIIGYIIFGFSSLVGFILFSFLLLRKQNDIIRYLYAAVRNVAVVERINSIIFFGFSEILFNINSFEKNPLRNGIPMREILPRIKHAEVMGRVFFMLLSFRKSCSFLWLCIMLPEHKNNIALKNA